jgi:hypothetical protein
VEIIEEEERLKSGVQQEDEEGEVDGLAAERLLARGLSVDFLVALTFAHNLWDWVTCDVVLRLVKPATEHRARCRFADLPEVLPFVGSATVFMSHSWAGAGGTSSLRLQLGRAETALYGATSLQCGSGQATPQI